MESRWWFKVVGIETCLMFFVSSQILVFEFSDKTSEIISESVEPKLKSPFSILVSVIVETRSLVVFLIFDGN